MNFALFAIVLMADFLLLVCVAISIFFPRFRIWPPPKKNSWQQWISWILFAVDMFGVPVLGILDFESIGQGYWARFLIGGAAILVGFAFDIWAIRILTAQQSLGAKGRIVKEGPYEHTRNPQYVGFILVYTGIILATYSFMALATGVLIILLFLVLPFSEEPWLRQQYGEPYIEYCKNVPRFIGVRSFKSNSATLAKERSQKSQKM